MERSRQQLAEIAAKLEGKVKALEVLEQSASATRSNREETDLEIPGLGPVEVKISRGLHTESPDSRSPKNVLQELLGDGLTPDERSVLILFYYEELSVEEIARTTNLSERQVDLIREMLLSRLRHGMTKTDKKVSNDGKIYAIRLLDDQRKMAEIAAAQQGVKLSVFVRNAIVKSAKDQVQSEENQEHLAYLASQVAQQLKQPKLQVFEGETDADGVLTGKNPAGLQDKAVSDELEFRAAGWGPGQVADLILTLQHAPRALAQLLIDELTNPSGRSEFSPLELD